VSAVRATLGPGRWHFQHGPIDLVIGATGRADAVAQSLEHAWSRFVGVLAELVAELPRLRARVDAGRCALDGPVARRMWSACAPFAAQYITPMAAVAGSVAQEIAISFERDGVERAWINNGGDIALRLAPGASARIAVCSDPRVAAGTRGPQASASLADRILVDAASPVRGVATSGWRGRSFSLGIADAVTVLAPTAAQADAAATMIANAVDCEDPAVVRRPASELKDDSDLGARPVTVSVGPLPRACVEAALDRGEAYARELRARGLVVSALLSLQGRSRIVENP
jgi:ApbE superfamily uncharacterized protein (UPF0280 family)